MIEGKKDDLERVKMTVFTFKFQVNNFDPTEGGGRGNWVGMSPVARGPSKTGLPLLYPSSEATRTFGGRGTGAPGSRLLFLLSSQERLASAPAAREGQSPFLQTMP